MKYMLQVRFNGADATISKLPATEQHAIFAKFEAISQLPGVGPQHASTSISGSAD